MPPVRPTSDRKHLPMALPMPTIRANPALRALPSRTNGQYKLPVDNAGPLVSVKGSTQFPDTENEYFPRCGLAVPGAL